MTDIEELKTIINTHSDHFYNLRDRWQDEREYENFDDYVKVFGKVFEGSSWELVKLTRSFKATIKSNKRQVTLKIKSRSISIVA